MEPRFFTFVHSPRPLRGRHSEAAEVPGRRGIRIAGEINIVGEKTEAKTMSNGWQFLGQSSVFHYSATTCFSTVGTGVGANGFLCEDITAGCPGVKK